MVEITIGGQGAQWDGHVRLGKVKMDIMGFLTMPWGSSPYSSSVYNAL
jgi:hypothetical protein